jgi:hypothetical protein
MVRKTFHLGRRAELGERLRAVREDIRAENGVQLLSERLNVPARTWMNYEAGVVVPAEVVLRLITLADVNPYWLLTGEGQKYA